MASYVIDGHPLNYSDLADNAADVDVIRGQMQKAGVGATIQVTVSAGSDAKVKGHKTGH